MFCACCGIIIFAVYVSLCEARWREYCGESQRRTVGEAQRIVMKPKKKGLRQSPVSGLKEERAKSEAKGRECCGKAAAGR
jgi:hypothetical protein